MFELTDLQGIDPLSPHYRLPKVRVTADLVRLLLARQKKVFGNTILETQGEIITPLILHTHLKLLVKKYGVEDVLRGIELSVLRGDHPASYPFIEEQILCLREWRSCPILKAYGPRIQPNKS